MPKAEVEAMNERSSKKKKGKEEGGGNNAGRPERRRDASRPRVKRPSPATA